MLCASCICGCVARFLRQCDGSALLTHLAAICRGSCAPALRLSCDRAEPAEVLKTAGLLAGCLLEQTLELCLACRHHGHCRSAVWREKPQNGLLVLMLPVSGPDAGVQAHCFRCIARRVHAARAGFQAQ